MNLIKMGCFIKELRKEKNLSQEEFAERFNVSRRTVSRWETGANLPDIDVLIDMADFFDVDLRDMLIGERKKEMMDEKTKETVKEVAEYEKESKKRAARASLVCFAFGFLFQLIYFFMRVFETVPTEFMEYASGFVLGSSMMTMVLGILYSTGMLAKLLKFTCKIGQKNR